MKVLKKNELSLFIKPLGIKDKLFLCLGILIYFDLLSPENLPGEQKLWQEVPPLLGDPPVLDMSVPKPKGEFLIVGKCYAPGEKPTPVSEVMVRVGRVEKKLYVFGDRFWQRKKGLTVISEPAPFLKMDISWKNAFGGQNFEKNPLGKGIDPVSFGDGVSLVPLPNLEYPGKLIVSPSDRPEPACFGPVDMMWPQRAKKRGTYDDKWLKERWPYFPDDMDYEFFNMAPEDQFLPDFFSGDEDIEIHNMHPDHPVIKSRLPKMRVRAFVTKKKDIKGPEEDANLIFEEVPLKIDTLWLFPEILRGVVIFRGVTEIQDEELDDVHRIFLALEDPSEEPDPIEKYLEEQKKFFDRAVPIDRTPIDDAQNRVAALLKRVRSLPKEIDMVRKKAMGKVPTMPLDSPKEMEKIFHGIIDNQMSMIDALEAQCLDMHAKWGHLAKIPTKDFFDKIRKKLDITKQHISKVMTNVQNALDKSNITKKEALKKIKEHIPEEYLGQVNIDPDILMQKKSINPWHDKGFPFVVRCRKNLNNHPEILEGLKNLGFNKLTVDTHWFGWNGEEKKYPVEDWGVKQDKKDFKKDIVLPKGLVIPRFNETTLIRILIQKGDLLSGENILVKGSDMTPLFIPAASILDMPGGYNKKNAPVIRVHNELQARFLEQEIGDCCSIVVLDDPSKELPDNAKEAISKAEIFLVLLTPKEADRGIGDVFFPTYPNCKTIIMDKGNSLFEMYQNGINIRSWIMEKMPEEFAERNRADLDFLNIAPKKCSFFPALNIKEMVQGIIDEVNEFYKPKSEYLKTVKKEMREKIKDSLLKANLDPDEVLKKIDAPVKSVSSIKPERFMKKAEEAVKNINEAKQQLKSKGLLTDEIKAELDNSEASLLKLAQDNQMRYEKGMAELEQAEKKIEKVKAGDIPEDIKAKFQEAGLDPDKVKKITREEAIEIYKESKSLEGRILSGVDLSKLDLRGVSLKGSICIGTNFKEAILDGGDLSEVIAKDADFSGASMQNIISIKGIFTGACMKEADLEGSYFKMCSLDKLDFTSTNFKNAKIEMGIFQGASFKDIDMQSTTIKMCMLNETKMIKVNLSSAKLKKCVFQKSSLKDVDLSSSHIKATQFFATTAENINFRHSTIDNGRMGKESCFQHTDFRDTEITQACFRESDLSSSDFTGSRIENSIFEKCILREVNFFLVPMKETRLLKCDLEGANMRGINLFLGSLKKSRLVKTDLRDSNLFSVDFYKTTFGKTKIKSANLKRTFIEKRLEFLTSEEIE